MPSKQRLEFPCGASLWAATKPAEAGMTTFALCHPYPDFHTFEGEIFRVGPTPHLVVRVSPGVILGRKLEGV